MDVLRLNDTSYLPDELVEGYSSMIWTERHTGHGEFQLHTPLIQKTKELIPEGSLLTLLDSPEIMEVETHSISVNDDGEQELKITGRTFDKLFLDRIILGGNHTQEWPTSQMYRSNELVSALIWNAVSNPTGKNPLSKGMGAELLDRIANIVITDSSALSEDPTMWWVKPGPLQEFLDDVLAISGLGIRTIRPTNVGGAVVSFDVSDTTNYGKYSKTSHSPVTEVQFNVYQGADRTRYSSTNEPVVFHYASGHIDSPEYLFSSKDIKNIAYVTSSIGGVFVHKMDGDFWWTPGTQAPPVNPSGRARKMLWVDGGSIGSDEDFATFINALAQKGMAELAKHNRQILFDGAISPLSPHKYGVHYFLGDTVTLSAEYGFEQDMMVAEYVRTDDETGDQGFPTLILANPEV